MKSPILPPRLRPGDRIALVAPAGPVSDRRIATALRRARGLELEPVLGHAVARKEAYLAGQDPERAADLQRAIEDPSVRAVWALRGGYGVMRLLRALDLSPLRTAPKAFIGFSDNTALHLALRKLGVVSFHGPHAGFDAFSPLAESSFRAALFRAEPAGVLPRSTRDAPPETLVSGVAEGRLIGGNLALLAAACGTPWQLRGRGKIVLIEEVDEPVYRIDRMLTQLLLAGALKDIAGLAIGRITRLRGERAERPLQAVLREVAQELGKPAVRELSFGHVVDNWTLPLGVPVRLDADAGSLEVLEAAVR